MKDVVARIARLRALQAKLAQAERVSVQTERNAAVDLEQAWASRVRDAYTGHSRSGEEAVGRGAFVLNGEMKRRAVARDVERLNEKVAEHDARCLQRETEQKVAERLFERRQARRRAEAMRKEQAELDELARMGWLRGES
ncbi:MAG: hypothetical protein ACJAZO_003144 [Myxococcota bacterium]|jgi:hypothetical protein